LLRPTAPPRCGGRCCFPLCLCVTHSSWLGVRILYRARGLFH
jgi:hypothetical protein